MAMSRDWDDELAKLRHIADELRTTFAVEGYTIDRGLNANEAFEDGQAVRSTMIRKIAHRAATRGAQAVGLDCDKIAGGGREIDDYVGNILKHHRVLRITEWDDFERPKVLASSPAILEFDSGQIWREERHLFGYEVGPLNTIETVVTAKILDIDGDAPGFLILGPVTHLEPVGIGPLGFQPADEDLDDDSDEGRDAGS